MPVLWLASFWNIGWKSFSPENPNGHHCSLISHSLFYNMILIGVPWLELPIIYWCYGAIIMLSLISFVTFHSLKYTGKTKANDWTHSSKSFRPITKDKVPSDKEIFYFFFCKMFTHWWGEYAAYVTHLRWRYLPYLTIFLTMPLLISLLISLFQRLCRPKGLTGDSQRYRKQLAFCLVLQMLQKEAPDICRRASIKKSDSLQMGPRAGKSLGPPFNRAVNAEWLWK